MSAKLPRRASRSTASVASHMMTLSKIIWYHLLSDQFIIQILHRMWELWGLVSRKVYWSFASRGGKHWGVSQFSFWTILMFINSLIIQIHLSKVRSKLKAQLCKPQAAHQSGLWAYQENIQIHSGKSSIKMKSFVYVLPFRITEIVSHSKTLWILRCSLNTMK